MTADNASGANEVQAECSSCGGTGIAGYISEDMASDGGLGPDVVGRSVPCSTCGGDGWVVEPADNDRGAPE